MGAPLEAPLPQEGLQRQSERGDVGDKLSTENNSTFGQPQLPLASGNLDSAHKAMKDMGIDGFELVGLEIQNQGRTKSEVTGKQVGQDSREYREGVDYGAADASRLKVQDQIPNTAEGDKLRHFLSAMNSGDFEKLVQFLGENISNAKGNEMRDFRNLQGNSGGLELQSAAMSGSELTATLKERDGDATIDLQLKVDEENKGKFKLEWNPEPGATTRLSEKQLLEALPLKLQEEVQSGKFSGVVALAKMGTKEPLFEGAAGLALNDGDRGVQVPNTTDTQFRLASMGKMFTGFAALQLVQQNKLNLDTNAYEYLKHAKDAEKIPQKVLDFAKITTVRELLEHTSGAAGDTLEKTRKEKADNPENSGADSTLQSFTFDKEKKDKFHYSNMGYEIMGKVIEGAVNRDLPPTAEAKDFHTILRENVFKELSMNNTGTDTEQSLRGAIDAGKIATGYTFDIENGNRTANVNDLPARGGPAGGGYSTAEDLIKFGNAVGQMMRENKQFRDLLTAAASGGDGYGPGFQIKNRDGALSVGHDGGFDGMTGDLRLYPESGYIVVVLSNSDLARRMSDFINNRLPTQQSR